MLFMVVLFPSGVFGAADYGSELPVSWSAVPGKMGL